MAIARTSNAFARLSTIFHGSLVNALDTNDKFEHLSPIKASPRVDFKSRDGAESLASGGIFVHCYLFSPFHFRLLASPKKINGYPEKEVARVTETARKSITGGPL